MEEIGNFFFDGLQLGHIEKQQVMLAFSANDESETCDQATERRRSSGDKRVLILVADDELLIRQTMVQILRSEGYDAVAVRDGEEAVECARKLHPDILLTDVAMPRLNGIEAAKQITDSIPKIRVICFSGHAGTPDLLTKILEEGYDFGFLSKPVKPAALIGAIKAKNCQ